MKINKIFMILLAAAFLLNASYAVSYTADVSRDADYAAHGVVPANKIGVKLTVLLDGGDMANEKRNNDALNKIESCMALELRGVRDIVIVKKNADVEIIVTALFTFKFEPDDSSSFMAVSITAHNMYPSNSFGWIDQCVQNKSEAENYKNTIGAIEYQRLKSFSVSNIKKSLEGIGGELNLKCFKKVREQKIELEQKARINNIISWKLERYKEWKSNQSMSILDEDLEKMGITFEQLLKEFRDMEKAQKAKGEIDAPLQ